MRGSEMNKVIKRNIRKFLKGITPPYITNSLKRKGFSSQITYQGKFSTFAEVIAFYPNASTYIQVSEMAPDIDITKTLYNKFLNGIFSPPTWESERMNLISSFMAGMNLPKYRILDIGGGLGNCYIYCRMANLQNLEWLIYDLEDVALAGEQIFKSNPAIEFTTKLKIIEAETDIVIFGSSLQYFENYTEMLASIIRINPKVIMIIDTPMGDVGTFVCAQINMPNITIPRLVFSESELIRSLASAQYTLAHKSQIYYPFHNFKNYDPPYSEIQHTNLIFIKS